MSKFVLCFFIIVAVLDFSCVSNATEFADKQATILKIERSINNVKTLQARFIQKTKGKTDLVGDLLVKKPNRMKLTYDNADPLLIADGYDLMFYEPSLDQLTHLGLNASPALMILGEKFSFKDERIQITDYQDTGRDVRVSVQVTNDPLAGKIVMIFDKSGMALKGWIMQDGEGNRTMIELFKVKINLPLEDNLFEFHAPKISRY